MLAPLSLKLRIVFAAVSVIACLLGMAWSTLEQRAAFAREDLAIREAWGYVPKDHR